MGEMLLLFQEKGVIFKTSNWKRIISYKENYKLEFLIQLWISKNIIVCSNLHLLCKRNRKFHDIPQKDNNNNA